MLKYLLLLSLFVSPTLAADQLWPRDRELATQLDVDLDELEEALGIDRAREALWQARVMQACQTYAETLADCSLQAATMGEQQSWADSGSAVMENEYANRLMNAANGKPDEEALAYLARACAADEPHAEVTLGWLLLHGIGVPRDARMAAIWNRKGALQGHPEGANNLGFQYEYGLGVPRNLRRARDWYRYAAIRGSDEALTRLQALEASEALDDENEQNEQGRA